MMPRANACIGMYTGSRLPRSAASEGVRATCMLWSGAHACLSRPPSPYNVGWRGGRGLVCLAGLPDCNPHGMQCRQGPSGQPIMCLIWLVVCVKKLSRFNQVARYVRDPTHEGAQPADAMHARQALCMRPPLSTGVTIRDLPAASCVGAAPVDDRGCASCWPGVTPGVLWRGPRSCARGPSASRTGVVSLAGGGSDWEFCEGRNH